jgi:hypothetical protein
MKQAAYEIFFPLSYKVQSTCKYQFRSFQVRLYRNYSHFKLLEGAKEGLAYQNSFQAQQVGTASKGNETNQTLFLLPLPISKSEDNAIAKCPNSFIL